MDLRVYYRKVREVEAKLPADDVIVISNDTPDGGLSGMKTEVSRRLAAKLLVEGRARLADETEAAEYRNGLREANRRAQEAAAAGKVQIAVVSEAELRAYRSTKLSKS